MTLPPPPQLTSLPQIEAMIWRPHPFRARRTPRLAIRDLELRVWEIGRGIIGRNRKGFRV
jgi:hypothetical protein